MDYIHDNKPPLSTGTSSIFLDIIIHKPQDKDTRPLLAFLETHNLGERSQTVEWQNEFTLRLSMWRGQYWSFLSDSDWTLACQDIVAFIKEVQDHYRPKHIEYDTRSFSVGLAKKVRREKHPIADIVKAPPAKNEPVWWLIS